MAQLDFGKRGWRGTNMNVILSRKAGGGGIHKIKVGGCKNQCLSIFFSPMTPQIVQHLNGGLLENYQKGGLKVFPPG